MADYTLSAKITADIKGCKQYQYRNKKSGKHGRKA